MYVLKYQEYYSENLSSDDTSRFEWDSSDIYYFTPQIK